MAIRKIKNKVQNSRAALQAHYRKVVELRVAYRKALGEVTLELQELDAAQDAAVAAEHKYEAGAKALNDERERLDGVFAARLQQARNEIAQLTGQVGSLQLRARRYELAAENAQGRQERAEAKAATERNWAVFACFVLLAQTVYYEEWYVPVVEFIKGLL